jgi:seryl-tRNA synthetase
MTRFITIYKGIGHILCVCWLGCSPSNPTSLPDNPAIIQQQLQLQVQEMNSLAYDIESQIDEVRRSTPEQMLQNREHLAAQIRQLTAQQQTVQQTFQNWKSTLQITGTPALPTPDEASAPPVRNESP